MPIYRTPMDQFRVWKADEMKPFIEACDERLRPIVALTWITGARIGEVMAVKPEDISVEGNDVMIKMMTEKVKGRPVREYTLSIDTPFMKEYVLPWFSTKPTPFGKRRAQQLLKEACDRTGMVFVFHELRHSRLTFIARNLRASMSEIMDWTGWRSPSQIGTYIIRESPKRFKEKIE